MKKVTYIILILLSLVSISKAVPIHPPITLTLENVGDRTVYYAFQDWNQYSDILCYNINSWATKTEVLGTIDPDKTETLTFQPLPDYRALCTNYQIDGNLTFGLSSEGAEYNLNNITIETKFKPFYNGDTGNVQYWNISGGGSAINMKAGYIFEIDSNSSNFRF